MKNFPKTLEEVFRLSIELEEKGYAFYTESAVKIKNSLGKRMLERLALDEQNHIKRIKEIYSAIEINHIAEYQVRNTKITSFNEVLKRLKTQMNEVAEELTQAGVDDQEVIDIALELEKHSYLFYEKAADFAKDKKVKKFYSILAKEEKTHYEILNKTRSFLEDPSLFFGSGGSY